VLDGAPAKRDGTGPDVSRADHLWCRIAAQWNRSFEETAPKLMELSANARLEGERYARRATETSAKDANQSRR
jgi:hypothetical protein